MPPAADRPTTDDLIAGALSALGSPLRLALLRQLRQPRALGEIELRPARQDEAGHQERAMSRQAVRDHLDRLLDVGVVLARDARRAYGVTQEFVINHQAVYALGEELRGLARMRSGLDLPVDTATIQAGAPRPRRGPGLVLVKGLDEGTLFPLESPPYERREWIVGRRRGVHVALDFDPFVSAENSRIVWEGGRHAVVDLPGSANGTSVNFDLLPKGRERVLSHGDVVGVGRSLLLYWGDKAP